MDSFKKGNTLNNAPSVKPVQAAARERCSLNLIRGSDRLWRCRFYDGCYQGQFAMADLALSTAVPPSVAGLGDMAAMAPMHAVGILASNGPRRALCQEFKQAAFKKFTGAIASRRYHWPHA